jgi:hypothetical protein
LQAGLHPVNNYPFSPEECFLVGAVVSRWVFAEGDEAYAHRDSTWCREAASVTRGRTHGLNICEICQYA